jgi:uncharacterized membrane protein
MKRLAVWIVFILSLAVVLHILVLRFIPFYITTRTVDAIKSKVETQVEENELFHGPLRYAGADTVVRDNPDTLTSFAALDLASAPVRIRCVVPPGDNYWSVSLFAWNTDTFYVVNDLEAPAPEFDLIVVKRDSLYQSVDEEEVVVSPTTRAIMIVRMNVSDRDDETEIKRLTEIQKQMWVKQIDGVIY